MGEIKGVYCQTFEEYKERNIRRLMWEKKGVYIVEIRSLLWELQGVHIGKSKALNVRSLGRLRMGIQGV